jgi:hypothetical protein
MNKKKSGQQRPLWRLIVAILCVGIGVAIVVDSVIDIVKSAG